MHQTFYIDVDEEITSVIDRLRKSKATENIFVIPQRALVLQSVINLRLLKKEADKLKKQIMLVSQDEQVRAISEKVGILFQSSMKGIEESDEIKENLSPKIRAERIKKVRSKRTGKKKRAEEIGSESFFEGSKPAPAVSGETPVPERLERENLINKELIKDLGDIQQKEAGIFSGIKDANKFSIASNKEKEETGDRPPIPDILSRKENLEPRFQSEAKSQEGDIYQVKKPQFKKEFDPIKERNINDIFRPALPEEKISQPGKSSSFSHYPPLSASVSDSALDEVPVTGKIKKFILIFGIVCFLTALLVGAYLIVPKAVAVVKLKSIAKKVDTEARGEISLSSVDVSGKVVPIKIIEKEKEKSVSFVPAAAGGNVSGKATGKITIYNEFSSASQPLVATTRFLTPEGKLFRLIKDTVVPGMSNVGGESKPGAVEVDVIADKAGKDSEIGPSTFSIPGFESSPKHEKFYAKSTVAMAISDNAQGADAKGVITASDIADAKSKVESELEKGIADEIKSEVPSGQVLLGDASNFENSIISSSSSETAGKNVASFGYSAKIKTRAMEVSESDLKQIVKSEGKLDVNIPDSKILVNLTGSDTDLKAGTASVKIHGDISLDSTFDANKFKSEILGKDEKQIKEILKNYPQVDGVEIDFKPSFLSGKVPRFTQRVEVKVEKGN